MNRAGLLNRACRARAAAALAGALAMNPRRMGGRHNLIGEAIGLEFVWIARPAHPQLRLNRPRFEKLEHGLISDCLFETKKWVRRRMQ